MSAASGPQARIYADYAAGAPPRAVAVRAVADVLASGAGNASSVHAAGARARALLESAREEVAAAIGARPLDVVFTSGATEANNLALLGVAAAVAKPLRIAVAATDHSSVLRPAEALAAQGHDVHVLSVASDGRLDPARVAAAAPDLLSVAVVNAETGAVQDCAALVEAARRVGAVVHLDAAQAASVLVLDVASLGCDLLTLSAHKVGGIAGAGALYVRPGTTIGAVQHGGSQERGLRAGTENVAGVVAFAAALASARAALPREAARLRELASRLRAGIVALAPTARVVGAGAGAWAPHIVDMGFPGASGESLVAALDLEGIAVSAGSACAAGASEPSHVLQAMGWSRADAASAVRFSLGWASTGADVDGILAALPPILARSRRQMESGWQAHAS